MVTCKECRFAESISDPSNIGHLTIFCHLNPPTPFVSQQGRQSSIAGVWPPVTAVSWCGKGELANEVTH